MTQLFNVGHARRCSRFYRNEHGHVRNDKPTFSTCCNDPVPDDMVEKFKARQRLDCWKLVVKFYLTGGEIVEFLIHRLRHTGLRIPLLFFQRRVNGLMPKQNDGTDTVAVVVILSTLVYLAFPALCAGVGVGYIIYKCREGRRKGSDEGD